MTTTDPHRTRRMFADDRSQLWMSVAAIASLGATLLGLFVFGTMTS